MKDNLTTYKIWAPDQSLWTDWAKPVLFSRGLNAYNSLEIPKIDWLSGSDSGVAVIVDLPGEKSVLEGLGLAELGYRPVPLYNGVYGPGTPVVATRDIVEALFWGADALERMSIRPDAFPAFLLDANRMRGFGGRPGTFDNRWCVFPQDMPSAGFLRSKGIGRVIVRSDQIQTDLAHILCRYQEAGIGIMQCVGRQARDIDVSRPSRFRSLWYRFQVMAGLKRNAAGGFGGIIPDAQSSGGYYRLG